MSSSAATAAIPAGEYVPTADERIVMYNVPWSHFEVQLAIVTLTAARQSSQQF
jgi:hypothetical protein